MGHIVGGTSVHWTYILKENNQRKPASVYTQGQCAHQHSGHWQLTSTVYPTKQQTGRRPSKREEQYRKQFGASKNGKWKKIIGHVWSRVHKGTSASPSKPVIARRSCPPRALPANDRLEQCRSWMLVSGHLKPSLLGFKLSLECIYQYNIGKQGLLLLPTDVGVPSGVYGRLPPNRPVPRGDVHTD